MISLTDKILITGVVVSWFVGIMVPARSVWAWKSAFVVSGACLSGVLLNWLWQQ